MKKSESKSQAKTRAKVVGKPSPGRSSTANGRRRNGASSDQVPVRKNPHGIPDYRLEVPFFYSAETWNLEAVVRNSLRNLLPRNLVARCALAGGSVSGC